MLSTGEIPQWLLYLSIGTCFFSACALVFSLYSVRQLRTEFPSKTLLNRARGEIDSLSGDLADLRERFSRFQKREGMREAREAKKTAAELQAEALTIMGQEGSQTPGSHPKAALYAKLRNH